MIRVCFVCLGNICRSPLGEGAFRALVAQAGLTRMFQIESAGTGAWHVGEAPDPRSQDVARKHGVDISRQRGQQFTQRDLDRFDYVRAMDASNLRNLRQLGAGTAKVGMLLARDVPDPYYGVEGGFEQVWDMVWEGCEVLLAEIREAHGI